MPVFGYIADAVTLACIIAVVVAVVRNFSGAREQNREFRERRSPVATASMSAFAVLLYLTIRLNWTMIPLEETPLVLSARSLGLVLMIYGAYFNILGRRHLKQNWADHVRIYQDQQLVTDGPYRLVRHPLYASLIWMFYGASIAYLNPLAAVENTLIFLPAMTWRARLEETALTERFGEEYTHYKKQTGRFFPRLRSLFGKADHV